MKKTGFLTLVKLILFVPLMAVVLTAFLTLSYCVPLDQTNFRLTVDEYDQEGWYTNVLELRPGYDQNFFSEEPGIQNVYNDMMDYYRAAGYSDKGPLYNAMAMGSDGEGNYARYWHGYAGVLRILLRLFDGKEIKFLSFVFQFTVVVFTALMIKDREDKCLMLLFLTQYVLLMPLVVSVGMTFAFAIDISFLGILSYIRFEEQIEKYELKWIFFCLIGILTCFFEELAFGVLTWGINIVWILILIGKKHGSTENVIYTILSGLSWIWGYGGIWLMKWILSSPIIGENVFADGMDTVLFRTTSTADSISENTGISKVLERYQAISENYKYYYYPVFYAILALWAIYLVYRLVRRKINLDTRIPALGISAFAPVVWYIVLANHTLGHRFFTYRIFNFGIIAVLSILLISTEVVKSREIAGKSWKNQIVYKSLIFGGSLIIALILASNKTEDLESKTVDIPGQRLLFTEFDNGILGVSMKPQTRKIRQLGIVLYPNTADGVYEFRLLSEGEVVYSLEKTRESFLEDNWQIMNLNWKVDPDKEYTFEIIPVCAPEDAGAVAVCFPTMPPSADFGTLPVLPEHAYTQLTYWLVYDKPVTGKKWIFYFLTWFTVFECVFIVAYNLKKSDCK